MAARKLKLPGVLHRELDLKEVRAVIDEKERTVELAFSSELPAERWFGLEILDHSPDAVDLSRMKNGAALLVNHDTDDQVGVVEKAEISPDRKGRAKVRFGTSARAEEIWNDVKSGIRRLVSVGYRHIEMVREKIEGKVETFRVLRWQPLEISIVSIPLDPSVGVGRKVETKEEFELEVKDMKNLNLAPAATEPAGAPSADELAPAPARVEVTREQIRREVEKSERERVSDIMEIAARVERKNPEILKTANRAIKEGMTVDQFRKEAMDALTGKVVQTPDDPPQTRLDQKDVEQFSILRAMRTCVQNIENPSRREGCFEFDVSEQIRKDSKLEHRGAFTIPNDVLNRGWIRGPIAQRDLTVGTGSLGGNLVAAELHSERFIELLRNRMMTVRMGAVLLTGLNGDFIIPRQSGATTAYWVTEVQATTESDLTLQQVTLTPKCVTGLQDYSKKLIYQSSLDVENLVRNDLTQVLAIALDLAALHGTGASGQPTGIISVSGIGDVAGGTNGAAPTWGNIVSLETEVATDNADIGTLGYLTNAKVRGKLKQTEKATNTAVFIWGDSLSEPGFGVLNGYRAGVSNQIASNLTKGTSTTVASAIFFGNWADLLYGQWGPGIDILIDPYTAAGTRVFKMYADLYADLNVRHAESFSAMKDALTT